MPTLAIDQTVRDLRRDRVGVITAVTGPRVTIQWSDGAEQNYVAAAAYDRLFTLDADADPPKPKRKPGGPKAAKKAKRSRKPRGR